MEAVLIKCVVENALKQSNLAGHANVLVEAGAKKMEVKRAVYYHASILLRSIIGHYVSDSLSGVKQGIYSYVSDHALCTAKEVADHLGKGQSHIHNKLRSLEEDGLVFRAPYFDGRSVPARWVTAEFEIVRVYHNPHYKPIPEEVKDE